MPSLHLTDLAIQNLKATGSQVLYYCDQTPNFGVRVSQAGTKTFFVNVGEDRKRISLGKYPALGLKKAREEAKRKLLAPAPHSTSSKLSEAIDAFLNTREYRPRPLYNAEKQLKRHFKSHLEKPYSGMTTQALSGIFDKLKETPSEANHLYGVARTFFRWAAQRGYGPNPLTFPKPYKERSRDRILTDDELVKVWEGSMQLETFGRIVRLCILTAQRRGEIGSIRPEWLGAFKMTIPGDVSKNGKAHTLPLTQEASKLAITLSEEMEKPWSTWSKTKAALDGLSGVKDWTLHDLRRTAASKMAAPPLSIAPHIIERILNHSTPVSLGGAVGVIYNRHDYFDEMAAALKAYEEWFFGKLAAADS
jgi:integrase